VRNFRAVRTWELIAVAVLRIPDENRLLREHGEVREYLAGIGIDYERWESPAELPANDSADQVLSAYGEQVEKLKRQGGYVTADVIDVNADTSSIRTMKTKFVTSSPGAGYSIFTRSKARL